MNASPDARGSRRALSSDRRRPDGCTSSPISRFRSACKYRFLRVSLFSHPAPAAAGLSRRSVRRPPRRGAGGDAKGCSRSSRSSGCATTPLRIGRCSRCSPICAADRHPCWQQIEGRTRTERRLVRAPWSACLRSRANASKQSIYVASGCPTKGRGSRCRVVARSRSVRCRRRGVRLGRGCSRRCPR
jgi:hypothetical protein